MFSVTYLDGIIMILTVGFGLSVAALYAVYHLSAPLLGYVWAIIVNIRTGWLKVRVMCRNKTASQLWYTRTSIIEKQGVFARLLFWIYVRKNFSSYHRHIIYERRVTK